MRMRKLYQAPSSAPGNEANFTPHSYLPIMLYGCELWTVSKTGSLMLEHIHQKILRTIQGLSIRCPSTALTSLLGSRDKFLFIPQQQLTFINFTTSMPLLTSTTPPSQPATMNYSQMHLPTLNHYSQILTWTQTALSMSCSAVYGLRITHHTCQSRRWCGSLQFGSEVPTVMGLNRYSSNINLVVLLGWSEVSVLLSWLCPNFSLWASSFLSLEWVSCSFHVPVLHVLMLPCWHHTCQEGRSDKMIEPLVRILERFESKCTRIWSFLILEM